jgi:hypothetical protein
MSEFKSFGFCSNTNVKVIVICDIGTPDSFIRELIVSIYALYVVAAQNPFQEIGSPITSKSFSLQMQTLVRRFNNSPQVLSMKK